MPSIINNTMQGILLIVDDEKYTREGLKLAFSENFDVYTACNPQEAIQLLSSERFDVVITDLKMGQQSGLQVIDKALALPHKPICIMMTAYGTIEIAVEAMKHGAYDFISKPIQLERLEALVQKALKERNPSKNMTKAALAKVQVLGKAKAFLKVLQQIEQVASSKTGVLITGETGTGKELAAHLIHQYSSRASKPFVPVHCAALPENLIESELFGHERGSFTGAHQRHIGLFESAHEGTLFLDEIGEIDLNTQVKLLRFLETKTIERIGGTQAIPLDIRLVCATNRDLKAEVAAGRFREDLFYRLNIVEIHLPSLRERKKDIPLLLNHYFNTFAAENQCHPPEISSAALEVLQAYNWPGNIRELRNFAENTVVMYPNSFIDVSDLDGRFSQIDESSLPKVTQNELQLIKKTLQETGGNKSEAAKLLGIPRRTFYRKLEKLKEND